MEGPIMLSSLADFVTEGWVEPLYLDQIFISLPFKLWGFEGKLVLEY